MRYMPGGGSFIAVMQQVFTFELRRIDAELARDDVHLAFVGEESLRIARCAHMTAGNFVRVDHSLFDQTVGHPVRPGATRRADQITGRLHRSVRAAVEKKVEMMRDDGSVALDARSCLYN